ncbi:MAG: hypothetical protein ABIH37_00350 [archaeon]
MSIIAEYCPELCLREFGFLGRESEECLPENLEINNVYKFLKKGQRHYWLMGEIALRKTKGNQDFSRPVASVIILEAIHYIKDGEVWTKGTYKIIETYNPEDTIVHFETTDKIK